MEKDETMSELNMELKAIDDSLKREFQKDFKPTKKEKSSEKKKKDEKEGKKK